jgi:hypothetical protein
VSCEDCFFHQHLLCAVSDAGPCATYRPNHPDGLRPPSQLRFVFRQDRRLQVAWAFPSASEQVAMHAGVSRVPARGRAGLSGSRRGAPASYGVGGSPDRGL